MRNEEVDLGKLGELDENLRLLLAAGLSRLSEELTERNPSLHAAEFVRSHLLKDTILSQAPAHVSVDPLELHELLAYLEYSNYWAFYWERGDEGRCTLVAEVAVDASIIHFEVASGLVGTESFFLAPDDAAFVETVRDYVRLRAPSTSEELSVAIVEVPVRREAMDAMVEDGEALEHHIASIMAPSDLTGVMTRGAWGGTHSIAALAEAEYVGVTAMVVDSRSKLDALPGIIANHVAGILTSTGR